MTITTPRLTLYPLTPAELRLWVEDTATLEKHLNITYAGETVNGPLGEFVKGQFPVMEQDPDNYLWHTFWFMIRKDDRTVVGSVDFKDKPDRNGLVEIGYGLDKPFEGQGYMTEAVEALCQWGLKQAGVAAITAETYVDNLPSQRVLQRCGFTETSRDKTVWWQRRV